MDSMTNENVEWGAAIPVEGKRPGWLGDDVVVQVRWMNGAIAEYTTKNICGWESSVKAIRLPANHPHYATPTRTALEQRMEDLVRRMAQSGTEDRIGKYEDARAEARAILAELEPVDPDKKIIDAMASAMWLNVGLSDPDQETMQECAKYALKAYRALERGE